MAHDVERYV